MIIWTAFLLGLAGSLHCAGMCGPLMLALPTDSRSVGGLLAHRLTHHAGRLSVYAGLGALLGLFGESLAVMGMQRWISIAVGVLIIGAVFLAPTRLRQFPVGGLIQRIRGIFANLLKRNSATGRFLLGGLNGLLPCGLVYVAGAGALASGDRLSGVLYMLAFGLGTMPMLLGVSLLGKRCSLNWTPAARRLVPVFIGMVGVVLVLRGMDLGIPYLSPRLAGGTGADCPCE